MSEIEDLREQIKGLENLVHFYETKCDCGAEHAELAALRTRVAELEEVNRDLLQIVKDLTNLMKGA